MAKSEERRHRRALVYDDNGLVALDTREVLLELGFDEVSTAACGDEALSCLNGQGLDWGVIDAGCPEDDLAAVIAAFDAHAVPYVLVCSDPGGTDIPTQWKGRTYLARPYSKADLEALVARHG